MEQSSYLKPDSRLDDQEFFRLLWNPNVHYRAHRTPTEVVTLSQLNPVNISVRHILIFSFQLVIGLPSSLIFYRSSEYISVRIYPFDLRVQTISSSVI